MTAITLRNIFLATTLALGGSLGCASSHKSQKEVATEQWNHTRATVLSSLAHDQYRSGNLDKSRETLDNATRLDPNNVGLILLSARIDIEQGRLESAQQQLGRAATLDPKDAEVDYLTGVVQQRWQRPEQARAAYARAVEKKPDDIAYLLAEAEMLVDLNAPAGALSLLQSKVVYFEHSAAIRDAIGQLLEQTGETAQAIDYYRQATVLESNDMGTRERLGLALFRVGEYRDALSQLNRVLREPDASNRIDLMLTAGECEMQLNTHADARRRFDAIIVLDETKVDAWLGVAKASLSMNDLRRAEQSAQRAISLTAANGGSGPAQSVLGYVRMRQLRFDDAAACYRRAVAADRTDTTSLCMLGMSLAKMGNVTEANACYARALKIDPKNELAQQLTADATASIGE